MNSSGRSVHTKKTRPTAFGQWKVGNHGLLHAERHVLVLQETGRQKDRLLPRNPANPDRLCQQIENVDLSFVEDLAVCFTLFGQKLVPVIGHEISSRMKCVAWNSIIVAVVVVSGHVWAKMFEGNFPD